jgi:hypothetical protein
MHSRRSAPSPDQGLLTQCRCSSGHGDAVQDVRPEATEEGAPGAASIPERIDTEGGQEAKAGRDESKADETDLSILWTFLSAVAAGPDSTFTAAHTALATDHLNRIGSRLSLARCVELLPDFRTR